MELEGTWLHVLGVHMYVHVCHAQGGMGAPRMCYSHAPCQDEKLVLPQQNRAFAKIDGRKDFEFLRCIYNRVSMSRGYIDYIGPLCQEIREGS